MHFLHLIIQVHLELFILFAIAASQIVFEDADERSYRSPDSDCATPDNEKGRCVSLSTCETLQSIQNWNLLQPYACGFAGKELWVCCSFQLGYPDTFVPPTAPPKRTTLPRKTTTTTPRPSMSKQYAFRINDGDSKPAFLPNNCGMTFFTDSRVVGGQVAEKGSWPWMVAILVDDSFNVKSPRCGGAIVTNRHVITAAHCVVYRKTSTPRNPSELLVRVGAHDVRINDEPGSLNIPVKAVRRHEEFSSEIYINDIAVLLLSEAIEFSPHISPVCLPYDSLRYEDIAGKTAILLGFGKKSLNGPPSGVLMQASFEIWDQEMCETAYEKIVNITMGQLCSGPSDGSKDACQGDSGGPLVTIGKKGLFYLIGVVSFGYRCATPGYPGVYTRVTTYLDWLAANLDD